MATKIGPTAAECAVDDAMSGQRRTHSDSAIAALAEGQHGVVTRRQLRQLGLSERAIDHRLSSGRLWAMRRGVFSVGHRMLSREGHWMAAVLSGGTAAVLSHSSAAALWRIRANSDPAVDVATSRRLHSRQGVRFHRLLLGIDEVAVHSAIPVTSPSRTVFDLASFLRPRQVERAVHELELRQLWHGPSLAELVDRHPGHRGVAGLRSIVERAQAGATITRSDLEALFLQFLDDRRFPAPEANAMVYVEGAGFEVDFLWREAGVVVELDSRSFHGDWLAFENDRERDRRLQAAGWRVVRVTFRHLHEQSERLDVDLRRVLARVRS